MTKIIIIRGVLRVRVRVGVALVPRSVGARVYVVGY